MSSISRVLPSGGKLEARTVPPLSLQTVDRPNPNAKFSKAAPSKTNVSTVFKSDGPTPSPRFGKRCAPDAQPRSREVSPRPGLRVSRFDEQQRQQAQYKEDHPRPLRRMAEGRSPNTSRCLSPSAGPATPEEPRTPTGAARRASVITMNGLEYSGGRKPNTEKNRTTMMGELPPGKDYTSMERFKSSDRTSRRSSSVLQPETLPTHIPPPKAQRFRASPEARHSSLIGVFGPDPNHAAPPAYRPRAPFHTD